MKLAFFLFLLSFSVNLSASSLDSLEIENTLLYYHKLDSEQSQKKGLVIFLHGGVHQFMGLEKSRKPSAENLLEYNSHFRTQFHKNGYDIVLPISFNQYNWLEDSGEEFILKLVEKYADNYDEIYISGFSDGGSGSYRIFYNSPNLFAGLMTFNGYPQLKNANKKPDYREVTNKKIIFSGTIQDKKIPYEFMMIEFRRQQIVNKQSYFLLTNGVHSFKSYDENHFQKLIYYMETPLQLEKIAKDSVIVYPPIDGLIENNQLLEIYPFRKKSVAKFGVSKAEYERSDFDWKALKKKLDKGLKIRIEPIQLAREELNKAKKLSFKVVIEGKESSLELNNWFLVSSW